MLWPLERAFWAIRERLLWPLQDRLATNTGGSAKVPRVATLGALGAIAIGALGAGALVASEGGDATPAEPQTVVVAQAAEQTESDTEPLTPIVARTEPKADQPALKGVRPNFGPRSEKERAEARSALRKLKSEQPRSVDDAAAASKADHESASDATDDATETTTRTDSGSTDSTTTGDDSAKEAGGDSTGGNAAVSSADPKKLRRKESPLNVAERFAMAFVSYEVGASGKPIEAAFKDTTDSDLFDSLMDRPPRQPTGGKVPKARVVNVVGGPRKKNAMEVSVGLLRVDGISEIRLTLKRLDRGWVVKTVRG